ncbi:hypothetical protein AB7M22_003240 [Pseudomonas sp. ADAK2 TE3594]
MTQSVTTPVANEEHTIEPASLPREAPENNLFEEFDLDDIEVIESKVFA